uniref:Uncharacterized protein n=1 Tax=Pipistrellus kuhlii TaxID=59472 RepID=A0A7J7ZJ50_PIPKU|nr:hypothetical protein mPipKuh1_009378 [Pipistrellus kuhlii]
MWESIPTCWVCTSGAGWTQRPSWQAGGVGSRPSPAPLCWAIPYKSPALSECSPICTIRDPTGWLSQLRHSPTPAGELVRTPGWGPGSHQPKETHADRQSARLGAPRRAGVYSLHRRGAAWPLALASDSLSQLLALTRAQPDPRCCPSQDLPLPGKFSRSYRPSQMLINEAGWPREGGDLEKATQQSWLEPGAAPPHAVLCTALHASAAHGLLPSSERAVMGLCQGPLPHATPSSGRGGLGPSQPEWEECPCKQWTQLWVGMGVTRASWPPGVLVPDPPGQS